jgi:hypothetical protein
LGLAIIFKKNKVILSTELRCPPVYCFALESVIY